MNSFAGLDEGRVGKALALAAQSSLEGLLAADPNGQMRPIEVHRPLVGAARDDRRDAGRLELLHRTEQVIPGLDRGCVDTGLREEILVVEEADLGGVHRHAVDLAVDGVGLDRRRNEAGLPGLHP